MLPQGEIHIPPNDQHTLLSLVFVPPSSLLLADLSHSIPNHWAQTHASTWKPLLSPDPFSAEHSLYHPSLLFPPHSRPRPVWSCEWGVSTRWSAGRSCTDHSSGSASLEALPEHLSLSQVHGLCPRGHQRSLYGHYWWKLYFSCLFTYSSPLSRLLEGGTLSYSLSYHQCQAYNKISKPVILVNP